MAGNRLKKQEKPKPVTKKADTFRKDKVQDVKVKELVKDERTHKVLGVLFLLLSVFLFISFTSYLFTWQDDQDKVFNLSYQILFNNDVQVENLLGRLGAYISHLFFYKGTGFASYLFCYLFFIIGINLIVGRKVFRIGRNIRYILFGLLFITTFLGFIFHSFDISDFPAGGALGDMLSGYLIRFIGSLGTLLLLLVIGLSFLIWKFNFDFKLSKPAQANKEKPSFPVKEEKKDNTYPVAETKNSLKNSGGEEINELIVNVPTINDLYKHDFQLVEKDEAEKGSQMPAEKEIKLLQEHPDEEVVELEINSSPEEAVELPVTAAQVLQQEPYEPTLDLKNYRIPRPEDNLLKDHGGDKIILDNEELRKNKDQIISTLKNYDIEIQKISATVGPTVTLYEIVPAAGVRISRIKNLEDDIALSLAALGIRIIAPIPGRGTIGIEVPNEKKTIVSMRGLLSSEKFQNSNMNLPIAIGKKIDNENFIVDLSTMPHLLMAGATGQGKSVGINAVLISLLYKKHPSQLKFVLVDPKKVELSLYKKIEKHFLAKLPGEEEAIITDTKKVVHTLNALCIEMDLRYDLLKEAGTRNIREYNEKFVHRRLNPDKGHRYLPFIVLVIDEFADLIMTAGKEIEMPIARLAQLARAVGMHLIIATQRPSVNIITGTIKANFPARIAFKVSSKVDSRTILDIGGAEQLIGKGDMLVSYNGELVRLQCAFVDTPEVDEVVNFIGSQNGYQDAYILPEYEDEKEQNDRTANMGEKDPLFEKAARIIVAAQQGSTSLLQRRMKLGYNRAGRLMDQLEAHGIVGPNQGSKAREVLIRTESELEQYLD
jgi:DNA segregation ATPase FtsK/SpoIIIE, S-DNA-T family